MWERAAERYLGRRRGRLSVFPEKERPSPDWGRVFPDKGLGLPECQRLTPELVPERQR